jgi:hypothetical protein
MALVKKMLFLLPNFLIAAFFLQMKRWKTATDQAELLIKASSFCRNHT